MSKKYSFYGTIAAALSTALSALLYAMATSNRAALGAVGEATAQEVGNAVRMVNLSFAMLLVTGLVTAILLARFILRSPEKAH
jgi:hypothetical protein